MTRSDLTAFMKHILDNNDYFAAGYANVYRDEQGRVLSGETLLMPNDTLGNYFYLRHDGDGRLTAKVSERAADCGPARVAFDDTITMQIIAVVKDADEFIVRNNLINTCMTYGVSVIPTSFNLSREQIVAAELRGMPATGIQAALARLGDWSIIRLTINFLKQYIPSNCVDPVCKDC